jgi:hypothetical protein
MKSSRPNMSKKTAKKKTQAKKKTVVPGSNTNNGSQVNNGMNLPNIDVFGISSTNCLNMALLQIAMLNREESQRSSGLKMDSKLNQGVTKEQSFAKPGTLPKSIKKSNYYCTNNINGQCKFGSACKDKHKNCKDGDACKRGDCFFGHSKDWQV